jgi:hypothetical protein
MPALSIGFWFFCLLPGQKGAAEPTLTDPGIQIHACEIIG